MITTYPNTAEGYQAAGAVPNAWVWIDGGTIRVYTAPDRPQDNLTADQIAYLQDVSDTNAARSYAKLRTLIGMTPAQVQAWVSANVTTLAQAQDAIVTLAIAVSILGRRL